MFKQYRNKETRKIWQLKGQYSCSCKCVELYRKGVKNLVIPFKEFKKYYEPALKTNATNQKLNYGLVLLMSTLNP
jgi:hypothetical protein